MANPVQPVVQQEKTTQPAAAAGQSAAAPEAKGPWSPAVRVAFRFCFVYFTLFSLSSQLIRAIVAGPYRTFPSLNVSWLFTPITMWTARHIFGLNQHLSPAMMAGDRTLGWIENFCILVIAIVATVVWSFLDRRRQNYPSLYKWFYLFMRFALAAELLFYGSNKFFPVQMGFPSLTRLLQPYGDFTLRAVLWTSVGASPRYEVFTGCAELMAGILLIIPRTATFGALVALADMVQVFTLNVSYDVMVKRFSFHLVLFALFLLAPEMRRLLTFFFTDKATPPSEKVPLFRSARSMRVAVAAQIILGLYMVSVNLYANSQYWKFMGPSRPKPSLYGIWNVDHMWIDGVERPPLLTDNERWRRVVFDSVYFMEFQRMDDSFGAYQSLGDEKAGKIMLAPPSFLDFDPSNSIGEFVVDRPQPDRLILEGALAGRKMKMQLKLVDRDKFKLTNSGFHWTYDEPPVVHVSNTLD